MFSSLAISLALATATIGATPVDRPERAEKAQTAAQTESPSRSGSTGGVSLGVTSFFTGLFDTEVSRQYWMVVPSIGLSIGEFLTPSLAILANLSIIDGAANILGLGIRFQLWPHNRFHVFGGVELAIGGEDEAPRIGVGFSAGLGLSVMALQHHSLYLFARGNFIPRIEDFTAAAATFQFGLGWQFH